MEAARGVPVVPKEPTGRSDGRATTEATVTGLGYELVDVERAPRGLLRITIDRVPGRSYPTGEGEFITVEDCEAVTRQLQYALEVDGVDYARLEVSSPGLDRVLRRDADFERFLGHEVNVVLKEPLAGRKNFKGVLGRAEGTPGWQLTYDEGKGPLALAFELAELRSARLVPVVDFKGRRAAKGADEGGRKR